MTLDQIEAFLAVAQYGNFTRAADSIFVTQPTLSNRITSLESELDTRLVNRSKGMRTVTLTQQGVAFVDLAEQWRDIWKRAVRLDEVRQVEELRISATHTISNFILLDIVNRLRARNLPISIHVMGSSSIDAERQISQDDADFALVASTSSSRFYSSQLIARYPISFVCSEAYPLEGGANIRVEDLSVNEEVYMRGSHEQQVWHDYWFGTNTLPPLRIENVSMIQPLFAEPGARWWALIPAFVAPIFREAGLSFKTGMLDHPVPMRDLYMLSRLPVRNPYYEYLFEDVIAALRDNGNFILEV